jgi:hypothetical protein
MQNGRELDHSKYQENGPENSTWKMGNKVGKLRSHTLNNMVYCDTPLNNGGSKAPSAIDGPLGPIFFQSIKPT